MKKCFYFPTWEEKNVMISLDESYVIFKDDICNIKDNVLDFIHNSLDEDSLKIYFSSTSMHGGYGDARRNISRIIDNKDFTNFIEKSTPSDPILAKLCELTGAKMYVDYVVLDSAITEVMIETEIACESQDFTVFCGDIFQDDELKKYLAIKRKDYEMNFNTMCMLDIIDNIQIRDPEVYLIFYEILYCNIFQEYSKFLRKEENKWEELRVLLSF
jgi:hypothetical protein